MSKNKLSAGLVLAFVVVILVGYLYSLLPGFLAVAKQQVLQGAEKSLNGALSFGEVRLSGFMEVTAEDVELKDKSGAVVFVAPQVSVRISLFDLIRHYSDAPLRAVSSIEVGKGSKVFLHRYENKDWNVQGLLKPSADTQPAFFARTYISGAMVSLVMPEGQWLFDLSGYVDAVANPAFDFDLLLKQGKDKISFIGRLDSNGQGTVRSVADSVDLAGFSPLLQEYTDLQDLQGFVKNLRLVWENKGAGGNFDGDLKLVGVKVRYSYDEDSLQLDLAGDLSVRKNRLQTPSLQVAVNGQQAKIAGGLSLQEAVPVADGLSIVAGNFDPSAIVTNSFWQGALAIDLLLDGKIDRELRSLFAAGKINFAKGVAAGVVVSDGSIGFSYQDSELLIRESRAGVLGGLLELSGKYNSQSNALLANLVVKGIKAEQIPGNSFLSGALDGRFAFTGKLSATELDFIGDFTSDSLSLRGLKINGASGRLVRQDGQTLLEHFSGRSGGGNVVASGVVEGAPLSLEFAGEGLPLSDILPMAGLDGYGLLGMRAFVGGSWDDLHGQVSFSALDGVVAKQPFRSVEGRLNLSNRLLSVESFVAQMVYGIHVAQGSVDFSLPSPGLDIQLVSKDVRLEPLAAFFLPNEVVTGNADNFLRVQGTTEKPLLSGSILMQEGSFRGQFVQELRGDYFYSPQGLELRNFAVTVMQTRLLLDGTMSPEGDLSFAFKGNNVRLEDIPVLDDIKLQGGISLAGSLTGKIDRPIFNGSINSNEVVVNGQVLENISGEAWSEAGVNNYVRIGFSHAQGKYQLDGGIDFSKRFAQGILEIENGDVKSLFAVAGQNLDVGGRLTGTMELNRYSRNGLLVQAQVLDGSIRGILLQQVDMRLRLHKGKLTVEQFEAVQGTGKIIGRGAADFGGAIDMEIGGTGLDAALLTAFMERPVALSGNMEFLVQASGNTHNPEISSSVQVSPGSLAGVAFDSLYGLFSVKDDVFTIDQLFIEKDLYRASAYGKAPVDLVRQSANRKNPNAQMDIVLRLDNADLSIIQSIFGSQVEWGVGKTEGTVNVKGTLEQPRLFGSLALAEGTLKFRALRNPLEKIKLDVQFSDDKVYLNEFSGQMGAGSFSAVGSLGISSFSEPDYRLNVKTDRLALASDIFTGPLTSDFEIVPQSFRGNVRPLVKGDVFLENISINLPVVPNFADGGSNLGLDVTVRTGKNVKLYNKILYDMLLEGNLHITGSTNYPMIAGSISVVNGNIRYLGNVFKIESATASFPVNGSFTPHVFLRARSRISMTDVFINLSGALSEMDLRLTSNPPMTQQEIFRLITLRTRTRPSDGGSDITEEDMRALLTAGLQMTFLGEVESFVKNTWALDEFRLYQGEITSGVGVNNIRFSGTTRDERDQYNVHVGKYISSRVMLGYSTSIGGHSRRYSVQYDFGRRMNLGVAVDEDGKLFYGVEYRLSF